jgi:hypothetical protein
MRDPLEQAFELLKADSTELAPNPNLEHKLMTEFNRQRQPRRWKKVLTVLAVLLGLTLAGGGIAMAAGFDPIRLFITVNEDGSVKTLDAQGNPTDMHFEIVDDDGTTKTLEGTLPPGTYQLEFVPSKPGVKK